MINFFVIVLNEWNSQVASFLSEVSLASRPAEINSLISKIESLSVHHRREQDVDEIFNTVRPNEGVFFS